MAQPTPYVRQTNFSDYQASNPTTPLSATALDRELNAIKTSLDETLRNLALIQRDDGEVANLSIGLDQLKVSILGGLDAPVPWVAGGTAYVANNTIAYIDIPNARSEIWWVRTNHTSTADFDADSAAYMTQIADFSALRLEADNVTFAPGSTGLSTDVQQAILDVNEKVVSLETKTGAVQEFDTFAEITTSTVLETGVTRVRTAGYNTADDGGAGEYKVVGTVPAHGLSRFYKEIAGGQYLDFMMPRDGGFVTEKHSGGSGVAGTDDWEAIQQLAYWCNHPDQANSSARSIQIRLVGPIIEFSKPWLISTGKYFTGVVEISGARAKQDGGGSFGGVVLRPTFVNGPPVVVQGCRDMVIEGIAFTSASASSRDYVTAMGSSMVNVVDEANWSAVGIGTQTAAEGFIFMDPYCGSTPATPTWALTPTFPSWDTGALFGRLQSTRMTIRRCKFRNREAAVVVHGSNSNSNGDFVRFEHCAFTGVMFGASFGNSQSRSVEFENCEFNTVYAAATTKRHGQQAGRFDGMFTNCSGTRMKMWLELHDTATGSNHSLIQRCYVESGWWWADLGTDGLYPTTLEISNSYLGVDDSVDWTPGPVIRGSTAARVEVRNSQIAGGLHSCTTFGPANMHCNGLAVRSKLIRSTGLTEKEYQRIGASASCGVYPNLGVAHPWREWVVRTIPFDEDTDELVTAAEWTEPRSNPYTTRDTLMPLHQQWYVARNQPYGKMISRAYPDYLEFTCVLGTPGASQCSVSISDRTATFTMGSTFTDGTSGYNGGRPGDLIYDTFSKTIWWIRSRTGTTVIAEQQTNFKPNGANYTWVDDIVDPNGATFAQNQGAWANATLYAADDIVQSATDGTWYITAAGGTSSGTDANLDGGSDTGVTWTEYQGETRFRVFNQRQYAPQYLLYGDFSTSSPAIEYYQGRKTSADDGVADDADRGFQVGDWLFLDPQQDGEHTSIELEITSINNSPVVTGSGAGIMTVVGSNARVDRNGVILTGIKAAPANEASR